MGRSWRTHTYRETDRGGGGAGERGGREAVSTFTQSCTFTCTEHQLALMAADKKLPWADGTLKCVWVSLPPKSAILLQQQLKYVSYILNYIKTLQGKKLKISEFGLLLLLLLLPAAAAPPPPSLSHYAPCLRLHQSSTKG